MSDAPMPPSRQMMRLRDMLDMEGIQWVDNSDSLFCRTQRYDDEGKQVFSAVCGRYAYGEIELWTAGMRSRKEDPIGLATAEEAMGLIRKEIGNG